MFKKFLLALGLIAGLATPAAAQVQGNTVETVVATVAIMQANIPGLQYPYVKALKYNADVGPAKHYKWVTPCTADGISKLSGIGTGCWQLQVQNNTVDVTDFGAYFDYPSNNDDGPKWTNAFTAANANGYSLTAPGGISNIGTTITMAPGVIVKGIGQGISGVIPSSDKSGSVIIGQLLSGTFPSVCFKLQNANSTAQVKGPELHDMQIQCGLSSYAVQYNSIAGGFTDDNTTQAYMFRPVIDHVLFGGTTVATIQMSKCFDAAIDGVEIQGGAIGIDLEGCDGPHIGRKEMVRIVGTTGHMVHLQTRSTFGNYNYVDNVEFLHPQAGVGAYIWSSARSAFITKNFFEGANAIACGIDIETGALNVTISDNNFTASPTNWLCVNEQLYTLTVTGNGGAASLSGGALFNAGAGSRYYVNGTTAAIITHFGNGGEGGFPFNSTSSQILDYKVVTNASPNVINAIGTGGYASSVVVKDGSFQLPNAAGAIYFDQSVGSPIVGTIDMCVFVKKATAGNFKVDFYDGGVGVSTSTFAATTVPKWYCTLGLVPATGATFRAFNDTAGTASLYQLLVKYQ